MGKTFRPYDPEQMFLMPVSMRDWLSADHLTYFVSEIVEQLDLSAALQRNKYEGRGYPPSHPVMKIKVLLYACCIGVPSLHKIEKRLEEDIAFMILAASNTPCFCAISDFTKVNLKAFQTSDKYMPSGKNYLSQYSARSNGPEDSGNSCSGG